ncbi:MAG: hypothetical protein AAF843_00880 [Bacteroidota bacterium]
MESISELALKGHFEKLKAQTNSASLEKQPLSLLMKALSYLEKVNDKGLLDREGELLINQLRAYSSEESFFKAKPMQRAGSKSKTKTAHKDSRNKAV